MPAPDLVVQLDAWLPQTQCTRCGFPDCRAYAEALATGDTDINRCPPGGDVTLHALAKLLGVTPRPLDPACGAPVPRTRAVIDETRCIGCRKCLDVCPVDAILGARQRMHTVLATECNGCGLCLPPCPVDCIALAPIPASGETVNTPSLMTGRTSTASRASDSAHGPRLGNRSLRCSTSCIHAVVGPIGDRWPEYTLAETEHWRRRIEARRARLTRRQPRKRAHRGSIFPDRDTIRRDIAAALERVRHKREGRRS